MALISGLESNHNMHKNYSNSFLKSTKNWLDGKFLTDSNPGDYTKPSSQLEDGMHKREIRDIQLIKEYGISRKIIIQWIWYL